MIDYQTIAKDSRKKVLELVYRAGTSHIGSLMGCADIFAVLFEKIDLDKDKFIAAKSWCAAMLYYHLWRKGKITQKELDSYCIGNSKFIGLVESVVPEIPFGVGSMGNGFPASVGFALSKKMKKEKGKIYCLMSDGELNCGTTMESALIAAQHKLDNLIVIVEKNDFQAMGKTSDILNIDIQKVFTSFGWEIRKADGHNYQAIERALTYPPLYRYKPVVIIAQTIKGKGINFMENENLWHYAQVKKDDYKKALQCLK